MDKQTDLKLKLEKLNEFTKIMRKRLISGTEKYGPSWLYGKLPLEEMEEELFDIANYAFLMWLKILILKNKIDPEKLLER